MELVLKAIDQRTQRYVDERKRCRQDFSDEAVHDFRIASRRLLALVDLLRVVMPGLHLKKLRSMLKDQLDSLDSLRDTQVTLAEFTETAGSVPELIPLVKFLTKREKTLLELAESEVREFRLGGITHQLDSLRSAVVDLLTGMDINPLLLSAVDEARQSVTQRMQAVDPAQPFTIHRVRIAFKKFRYMIEIVAPLAPGFPDEQFKNMHGYQAAMGEIQDVEVMLRTVAEFAKHHKDYDPQPVRSFYEKRHTESINTFIEDMQEFVTFWRPTPKNPFPWETN